MAIFKCSQCGGDLIVLNHTNAMAQCAYCGTRQTVAALEHIRDVQKLQKNATFALEDKEWQKAQEYYAQILQLDSENEQALLGVVLADYKINSVEEFFQYYATHDCSDNLSVVRLETFADEELKQMLRSLKKNFLDKQNVAQSRIAAIQKYANKVATGASHTIALTDSGRVIAQGNNHFGQCNVSGWREVVAVAANGFLSVGLFKDGMVKVTGSGSQANVDLSGVKNWRDMKYITAGQNHVVAIRNSGKPFAVGLNTKGQCDVLPWNNITAVAAGYDFTVGLKADGTAVFTGNNRNGALDISRWKNLKAIAAGSTHIVGLCKDGSVVAKGANDFGECNVDHWSDIIAICACQRHTAGLKADGKVVVTGQNTSEKYDVSSWDDVVLLAIGSKPAGFGDIYFHLVGAQSDGKLLFAGDNHDGQGNISSLSASNKETDSHSKPAENGYIQSADVDFTQHNTPHPVSRQSAMNEQQTWRKNRRDMG